MLFVDFIPLILHLYKPVSDLFNVKVRFLVAALLITSSFLYHIVEVSLMVLLTHPNVTVRPSNSSKLVPSSNLTSIDATKPIANEGILLRSVSCHPVWDN